MVNSYIKAQSLQQNVLIANQLLSLDKTNMLTRLGLKKTHCHLLKVLF